VALSDEQNAMLRLLASGEQGYGDIAALMGLSEEEVRAKVVGALAQLQAEGKPAPDIPPPVAGGAPSGAAGAAPLQPEPVAAAPAEEPPAPEPVAAAAEAPKAPTPPTPAAPPPSTPPPPGGRTVTIPSGPKAWALGGLLLAVIVAAVVIVLIITSGGGSDHSSTKVAEGNQTAAESEGGTKEATQAELIAVNGSEAEGLATFGRVKKKLALQIEAKGLEGTTEGTDAYTIWLAQSPQRMLPLASTGVEGSGKNAGEIAAEFEVPVEVLAYLAKGTFDQIAITRTHTQTLEAALKLATKRKTTPAYTGEAVLRGTITGPIIGISKGEEAQDE